MLLNHVTLLHAYNLCSMLCSRVYICCLSSLNVHLTVHIEIVRCALTLPIVPLTLPVVCL